MEAARKRKASQATPSTSDGGATKKLKLLNTNGATPSRPRVQDVGQKAVDQLKKAVDKSGTHIATDFLELPDRNELPDYYEFIKLPIAISTIEAKVKRNAYPSVSAIESDFKRMVQNAKDYNDPNSQIYEHAEKIRKLIFNFMKNNNPAYTEQPGYSALPTPIPDRAANGKPPDRRAPHRSDRRSSAATSTPTRAVKAEAEAEAEVEADPEPAVAEPRADAEEDAPGKEQQEEEEEEDGKGEEVGSADLDLTGKTFQEAQQAVLSYLIDYRDPQEGLQIYLPFSNLPSRKLEDYYRTIRRPVSLRSVAKRARGQHGRLPPTGISDFKTWDAFAEEVSYIWRNAKEYNEDGSDMFNLALEFEEHFKSLLKDAKEKIEEPSAPKIKLGGPKPKVTLNLSQHRKSSTPPRTTASVSAEPDASQQNPPLKAPIVNDQSHSKATAPTITTSRPSTTDTVRPSSARSGSSGPGSVKTEKTTTQSPAPNGIAAPIANGTMPPPAARPPSNSPFPGQQQLPTSSVASNTINSLSFTVPAALPPTRQRNYPLESALLPVVTINSHPQLHIKPPFKLSLTPHATLANQSATITVPASHYYLQIQPTISRALAMGRPYKLFVALNGSRLTQRDTLFHAETGRRTHVYEGSLAIGVNRIEVEVVAAAAAVNAATGEDKPDGEKIDGGRLDVEKTTIFAHLMR